MSRSAKLLVAAGVVMCLSVFLVVTIVGCGGGGGGNPPSAQGARTLVGTVTDAAANPLGGVTVDFVSSASAGFRTTNAAGAFSMRGAPAGQGLVRFAKPGYVTSFRVVSVPSGGSATVRAALSPVGRVVSIDPTQPQTVADDRGDGLNAKIVFPANSLPATATTVEITTSVQGDANYNDTFPGQFVGVPTGGAAGPLQSFAIAAITVRDASGDKLQLNNGSTATLTIPVSPGNDPGNATIPLWRLNESTGLWEQVAVATRVDGAPVVYTADVDHLSTFNIDIPTAADGLRVIAVDYTTHPEYRDTNYPDTAMLSVATLDALPRISGAWIQVIRENWAGTGNGDGNGELVLSPPAGYSLSTLTGSKMGYKDSRIFSYTHANNQAVVYVGLQKDVTWVPPITGDVGTIVK